MALGRNERHDDVVTLCSKREIVSVLMPTDSADRSCGHSNSLCRDAQMLKHHHFFQFINVTCEIGITIF